MSRRARSRIASTCSCCRSRRMPPGAMPTSPRAMGTAIGAPIPNSRWICFTSSPLYGASEYHAEMLLGHAMFVFHETPVLTRQSIGDALRSLPGGIGNQKMNEALRAALLEEQIEQIKIVPRVLSVEEISKIWGALQSQYRTTAAYHVSVVLIEAAQPARNPLPVLTRGRPIPGTDRDEGVFVQANLLSSRADVTGTHPPNHPGAPHGGNPFPAGPSSGRNGSAGPFPACCAAITNSSAAGPGGRRFMPASRCSCRRDPTTGLRASTKCRPS